MKEFLKKNNTVIWCLLSLLAVLLGVFVNVGYGVIVVLLIGVHFYIEFGNHLNISFTEFDSFAALLVHLLGYFAIIAIVSSVIDRFKDIVYKHEDVHYCKVECLMLQATKDGTLAMFANKL